MPSAYPGPTSSNRRSRGSSKRSNTSSAPDVGKVGPSRARRRASTGQKGLRGVWCHISKETMEEYLLRQQLREEEKKTRHVEAGKIKKLMSKFH